MGDIIGRRLTVIRRRVGSFSLVHTFRHDTSPNARPGLEIVHPAGARFELLVENILLQRHLFGLGTDQDIAEKRAILTNFPQLLDELLFNIGKLRRPAITS